MPVLFKCFLLSKMCFDGNTPRFYLFVVKRAFCLWAPARLPLKIGPMPKAILPENPLPFSALLTALEAAGEGTRLRILRLLREAELTVSEIMTILGQSQPRVSRHLRLLVDAGLVARHREGAWAFFRLSEGEIAALFAQTLLAHLEASDPVVREDQRRLMQVRAERQAQADAYFARHAADWAHIRALHIPEARVEAEILALLRPFRADSVLDLGTGTGRMLEVLAPNAARAVGVDVSPAMLGVARAKLDAAGMKNIQLRQGSAYVLPPDLTDFDLVLLHQVLHFLDDPARAIGEAARALKPGGRLLIVDFAPHTEETLRRDHAHRRLGFSREEISQLVHEAGLSLEQARLLEPQSGEKATLAVGLWLARDKRRVGDFFLPGEAPADSILPTPHFA